MGEVLHLFDGLVFRAHGGTVPISRQRDPEVVFWPSGVFVEAWGTKAKKPHIFKNNMFCWPSRRGEALHFFDGLVFRGSLRHPCQ